MDNSIGFNRPTLEELINQTKADYEARLGVDASLRRNTTNVFATVQAGLTHLLHGHIDYASQQTNALTATGEYLDLWGAVWGVARKQATYATGTATFTGVDGSAIPKGTIVQRADLAAFVTTAPAWIAGNSVSVAIQAVEAGSGGNSPTGTAFKLPSPLIGVSGDATGQASGGTDTEVDGDPLTRQAYRGRIMARIQQPPHGGAAGDYSAWALAYPGVTRAWVAVGEMGEASVTVRVMMDDTYADGIPPAEVQDAIQGYIDGLRPVTAKAYVSAPIAQPTNFTITDLYPATPTIKQAIVDEIKAMLRREGAPGKTIPVSKVWEAVSVASGEDSHKVTEPTGSIVPQSANHIITFGTIAWG